MIVDTLPQGRQRIVVHKTKVIWIFTCDQFFEHFGLLHKMTKCGGRSLFSCAVTYSLDNNITDIVMCVMKQCACNPVIICLHSMPLHIHVPQKYPSTCIYMSMYCFNHYHLWCFHYTEQSIQSKLTYWPEKAYMELSIFVYLRGL